MIFGNKINVRNQREGWVDNLQSRKAAKVISIDYALPKFSPIKDAWQLKWPCMYQSKVQAYWQTNIKRVSERTIRRAFRVLGKRINQFQRMSFGLTNAPAKKKINACEVTTRWCNERTKLRGICRTVLLHQLERLTHVQKLRFARVTRLVRTTAPGNQ